MIRKILTITAITCFALPACLAEEQKQPNVILLMADDLGYGDTGFNGNSIIKTPSLDKMAIDGAVMTNFHAAAPVCSPTRGSVLTGRHPYRYGIFSANIGHLPKDEITLAELLKSAGYATGHFGKWHLGTLSKEFSAKGKKRKIVENYSPPAFHGYDESFVTESAVATWDPSIGSRAENNPFWHNGVALSPEDPSLKGGASRVVMDRALDFIDNSVKNNKPFFTVIWFHAPHAPVIAGPDYLALYPEHGNAAHYYGAVTEMDEQIGRLRDLLAKLDVTDNTFISFTSDNGPEGKTVKGRHAGISGELRGRKRSLYEGGVRVPTVMLYPNHIKSGQRLDNASSTLDYLPTILAITKQTAPQDRPLDGRNLLAELTDKKAESAEIPFYHKGKLGLIKDGYKLLINSKSFEQAELYHLTNDVKEQSDLAATKPELVQQMTSILKQFQQSFRVSHQGGDYSNNSSYQPVDVWPEDKAKTVNVKKNKKDKKSKKESKKKISTE
ncbi:sulfatase-like hydrolase/transferase [Thalassotalea fonticola]|uniref:Sulfatase-like hydrolase/transferase n=1 Tax=Thalassotalea fonticola TaxID=3065649 RepID=A0ABZ0GUX8_9GAMM|nr:sulfatase-like hydrolase/transferase [Colwelliaceae bacterium S1-1]